MMRAGLVSMIYRQTTSLRVIDLKDKAAVTLMDTDVGRVVGIFTSIHELWASVLEVAIAIFLLERQVFAASIVPVVVVICEIGPGPPFFLSLPPPASEPIPCF